MVKTSLLSICFILLFLPVPAEIGLNPLDLVDRYWVVDLNKQYGLPQGEFLLTSKADSNQILSSNYAGGYICRKNGVCEEFPRAGCGIGRPQKIFTGTWQLESKILVMYHSDTSSNKVYNRLKIKLLNSKVMQVKVL